jgi:hypothetical protein
MEVLMAKYRVHLIAFQPKQNGEFRVRDVEVKDSVVESILAEVRKGGDADPFLLEAIFWAGQNEANPMELASVSVGDVVEVGDKKYLCLNNRWQYLNQREFDYLLAWRDADPAYGVVIGKGFPFTSSQDEQREILSVEHTSVAPGEGWQGCPSPGF